MEQLSQISRVIISSTKLEQRRAEDVTWPSSVEEESVREYCNVTWSSVNQINNNNNKQ